MKPTVVALVGPTGSGKTAASLWLAEKLSLEVIACDSRTIYRRMDIGTAKPSFEERQKIPHHLIDVANIDETFTAAEFAQQATKAIETTIKSGKLPVVCGGTGFYARALLEGLKIPQVSPQSDLRLALNQLADSQGNQALLERLNAMDPVSAKRINVNDRFRLIRAIEVSTVCGRPFSDVTQKVDPPYRTIWVGLTCNNRSNLYECISRRFAIQIQAGLLDEVESLFSLYGPCQTLLNTVNYKELISFLQGRLSRAQAEQECLQHNCNLARRQLIWFRPNLQIKWFACDEKAPGELFSDVHSYIQSQL